MSTDADVVIQTLYSVAQHSVPVCKYLVASSRDMQVLLDILQGQACTASLLSVVLSVV